MRKQALLRMIISMIATSVSLYWSVWLGWIPCDLCWYERICMYPIALISIVSLIRRIPSRVYTLPLAIIGLCISLYHYILQIVPTADHALVCTSSFVSCAVPEFDLFGFITPPLLAFLAFAGIVAVDVARGGLIRTPSVQNLKEPVQKRVI